jgi:thioester reductase-like protein
MILIIIKGSSGKPKGVVLTHGNTEAMLHSFTRWYNFTSRDIVLSQSSMSFDLSVAQIWGALTTGATLALPSQEDRKDPSKLAQFMCEVGVTITYGTATQFAIIIEHNAKDLAKCNNWRLALFAGEYLPVRLAKSIYDLKTPVTVFNQWGPTETTVQTSSHKVTYPADEDLNLPIGFPLPNCSHYVVDSQMKPVPASVIGEFCIGGAQVAAGYLNKPEATSAKFIKDPFASSIYNQLGWATLHKTGDTGRFLPNGEMDFKGRISGDKQIKLRGHRIDLAEVEQQILSKPEQSPSIKNVVILPRGDSNSLTDDRKLIAFLVSSNIISSKEQQELVNNTQRFIAQSLNDYMLPNAYHFLDCMPLLISGKIDRLTLLSTELKLVYPSLNQLAIEKSTADDQKTQEVLKTVTSLFSTILKLPSDRAVLATDNFFELGGSSVLLLRLQAQLKRKLKCNTHLKELFESPTPQGITNKILGIKNDDANSSETTNSVDQDVIDFVKECSLPSEPRYQPTALSTVEHVTSPGSVLLIGVESFNGIHLLASLLSSAKLEQMTIYTLGSSAKITPSELDRLFKHWSLYSSKVTPEILCSRTSCVNGSLTMGSHFGLSSAEFESLGNKVQTIYHLGGDVSLLKTYTDLKPMNVNSTLDVVELACIPKTYRTEIHYLSTWSVPHLQSWSSTQRTKHSIIRDEQPASHFTPGEANKLGYFKARWVAERLIEEASTRGVPVSIYRSSAVTADPFSATSHSTPEDTFSLNMVLDLLSDSTTVPKISLDSISQTDFAIDFIPVTYLSATLTALSTTARSEASNLNIYHITNPNPASLASLPVLSAALRHHASPSLQQAKQQKQDTEQQKILEAEVFAEYLAQGHCMFALDSQKTLARLACITASAEANEDENKDRDSNLLLACPPVDEKYLAALLVAAGAAGKM